MQHVGYRGSVAVATGIWFRGRSAPSRMQAEEKALPGRCQPMTEGMDTTELAAV